MALNLDIIGKKYEGKPRSYSKDTAILYALSIGAGVEDLRFIYEKDLKVYPSFASVAGDLSFILTMYDDANIHLPTALHGEQKMIFRNPVPHSGTIFKTGVIDSIYDKGDKGAILNFIFEIKDENDQIICESHTAIIDRSAGNFGGDKGPKKERFDPPEGVKPDYKVEYTTTPNQAAIYRLNGDKNPLHIDPEFSKICGFERPILHGMCTYGYTTRAIVNRVCDYEPERLKSFVARFINVVYPGETVVIEAWNTNPKKYIIRTSTIDGRVVLGNALAEVESFL
jgi:acyl dehydratase